MTAQLAAYQPLVPLLVAAAWAVLVLVAEMFSSSPRFASVGWLSIIGLLVIGLCAWPMGSETAEFGDAVALDGLTTYVTCLVCALTVAATLMAMDYLPVTGVEGGEYYPLVMFAVVGLIVMAAATDLIVMFLGLETMSMAVYVLAGLWKRDLRSNEAALKYFLMGAFASAFMLYGIALMYAQAGSTSLADLSAAGRGGDPAAQTLLLLGAAMVIVGLGFKIAAVPFHLWTPDVYEGSPSSVTAFMATAVKAGAFAALLRTLAVGMAPLAEQLDAVLWAGAALTMTVGNVVALRQTSLKRMLAYSSIAHTGYLLVGLVPGTAAGGGAVLFYLAAYGAMNLGAFGVMMALARRDEGAERIRDLAGLGQRNPMLALAMTVSMLSLMGMPPLGGFVGKLYVFSAALEAGYVVLVLIAVLNSVISAAYYLGVVRTMYLDEGGLEPAPGRPYLWTAIAAATAATLVLGLAPSKVLDAAASAVVVGRSIP